MSRLHAFEEGLDAREARLAELREGGAVVRRREHDEVREGALVEGVLVVEIHPFAHDRAASGVGDAGELLPGLQLGREFVADGLVEGARDVIHRHGVVEADVAAEIDVADLDVQPVAIALTLQPARKIPVGRGIPHAPSVNEYYQHSELLSVEV